MVLLLLPLLLLPLLLRRLPLLVALPQALHDLQRQGKGGVDGLQAGVAHQRQARNPEEGVVHVDLVLGAVGDATALLVLRHPNHVQSGVTGSEAGESQHAAVDPIRSRLREETGSSSADTYSQSVLPRLFHNINARHQC